MTLKWFRPHFRSVFGFRRFQSFYIKWPYDASSVLNTRTPFQMRTFSYDRRRAYSIVFQFEFARSCILHTKKNMTCIGDIVTNYRHYICKWTLGTHYRNSNRKHTHTHQFFCFHFMSFHSCSLGLRWNGNE